MGALSKIKSKAKQIAKDLAKGPYGRDSAKKIRMDAARNEPENREKIRSLAPKEARKKPPKAMTRKKVVKQERWQPSVTGGGRIAAIPSEKGY